MRPHSVQSWAWISRLPVKRLSLKRRKNPLHSGFRRQMFCDATFWSIVFFDRPAASEPSLLEKKKNPLLITFRRQMFCGATFCLIVGLDPPAVFEQSLLEKKKKSPSHYIHETNVLRCHILLDCGLGSAGSQ